MSHEIPPAIRRAWSTDDSNVEVLNMVADDTRFQRGFGRIGKYVEHVVHECPSCGHDEMVRLVHTNPESRDDVLYWCLKPQCRYFVSDELSWATKPHPQMVPDAPMIWDNSAECPDCGDRHTVTIERDSLFHDLAQDGTSCIVETLCEECAPDNSVPLSGADA